MLKMYKCYTPKPTNTYCTEECCASDLGSLVFKSQINAAKLSLNKRLQTCKKQPVDISNMLSELIVISSNMSCLFTIIKTESISRNSAGQLLFSYKITLFTSHSHSFVCRQNIIIKFMHLINIPWH